MSPIEGYKNCTCHFSITLEGTATGVLNSSDGNS